MRAGEAWVGADGHQALVVDWRAERGFELISIGSPVAGSSGAIAFPGADDPVVSSIAGTVVAELLAAELWRRNPI